MKRELAQWTGGCGSSPVRLQSQQRQLQTKQLKPPGAETSGTCKKAKKKKENEPELLCLSRARPTPPTFFRQLCLCSLVDQNVAIPSRPCRCFFFFFFFFFGKVPPFCLVGCGKFSILGDRPFRPRHPKATSLLQQTRGPRKQPCMYIHPTRAIYRSVRMLESSHTRQCFHVNQQDLGRGDGAGKERSFFIMRVWGSATRNGRLSLQALNRKPKKNSRR